VNNDGDTTMHGAAFGNFPTVAQLANEIASQIYAPEAIASRPGPGPP